MAAILTSISPATGKPGTTVTVAGTGIVAGAAVVFTYESVSQRDAHAALVDAGHLQATVPDLLDGLGGVAAVSVVNPGEEEASNSLDFTLQPELDIEEVSPLCSLGALKRALGVALYETLDNDKYRRLIQIASAQIARACREQFAPITIAGELRDGDGSNVLALVRTPIRSVTALSIDGQAVDVSELRVYDDHISFADSPEYEPRLRSAARVFPRGNHNISVSYEAGYARIPADISDACVLQVMFLQNTAAKQGIVSETNNVAQSSTTYADSQLAPSVKVTCSRYRKSRPAVV